MTKRAAARRRRDRWSDWAVVATLAIALLLGWAVMAYAQGQREQFSDAGTGFAASYPSGWLLKRDDSLLFQAVDPAIAGFKTTYQVQAWLIAPTEPLTASLAAVLNDAALARAQDGTAYRLLELAQGDPVHGQDTMEAEYVYVVEGSDLFVEQLPTVVRGLDVAVPAGDRALVFSLLAGEDAYPGAVRAFRGFVESGALQ